MFYGLSKRNKTLEEKLERVITLAPCLWITFGIDTLEQYNQTYPVYRKNNVNAIGSPNWKSDKEKICALGKDSYACQYLNYMPEDAQGTAMKSLEQYSQNYITGKFQEYITDFSETN